MRELFLGDLNMYQEKIESLRERIGIPKRRLAEFLSINYSTYCDYENENVLIPLKHLNTICNYFNVSIDYIFNFNSERQYKDNRKDIDMKLLSERLKKLRKNRNIKQQELANCLNIGNGTISGYENSKYLITTHALYDICKKYKISADYLLGKIDEPKYFK